MTIVSDSWTIVEPPPGVTAWRKAQAAMKESKKEEASIQLEQEEEEEEDEEEEQEEFNEEESLSVARAAPVYPEPVMLPSKESAALSAAVAAMEALGAAGVAPKEQKSFIAQFFSNIKRAATCLSCLSDAGAVPDTKEWADSTSCKPVDSKRTSLCKSSSLRSLPRTTVCSSFTDSTSMAEASQDFDNSSVYGADNQSVSHTSTVSSPRLPPVPEKSDMIV